MILWVGWGSVWHFFFRELIRMRKHRIGGLVAAEEWLILWTRTSCLTRKSFQRRSGNWSPESETYLLIIGKIFQGPRKCFLSLWDPCHMTTMAKVLVWPKGITYLIVSVYLCNYWCFLFPFSQLRHTFSGSSILFCPIYKITQLYKKVF